MTNEIREQLTDHIYNALRDIEREKDVRLGDRAFIADHLAPKIQPLIDQARAEGRREVLEWMRKNSSESLTKAGLFQVVVSTQTLINRLKKWGIKSGQALKG